jgi:hypothetical protein
MLNKCLPAVFAAIVLVSPVQVVAADHLEPWPKPDEFRAENSKIFLDSFGPHMRLFGTLDAPMDAKVAVGMEVEDGHFTVSIWAVKRGRGSSYPNCDFAIPAPLGAKIDKAWAAMIGGARFDDPETVELDGIVFFFARNYDGKPSVATAWTPESDNPAALADI